MKNKWKRLETGVRGQWNGVVNSELGSEPVRGGGKASANRNLIGHLTGFSDSVKTATPPPPHPTQHQGPSPDCLMLSRRLSEGLFPSSPSERERERATPPRSAECGSAALIDKWISCTSIDFWGSRRSPSSCYLCPDHTRQRVDHVLPQGAPHVQGGQWAERGAPPHTHPQPHPSRPHTHTLTLRPRSRRRCVFSGSLTQTG